MTILGLLAAGCRSGEPRLRIEHDARRPLVFAMIPFADRASLEEAVCPLTDYLAGKTGQPIRFRVVSSYTELDWAIAQGRIDLGWFAPAAGGGAARDRMEVLARAVPAGGRAPRGVIVARPGLSRLEDLAGKRFVYVDRRSRSGFLLPNRLLAARGLEPLRFFGKVEFAGNHERVLERVLSGAADAGALSETALGASRGAASRVTVLAATEPVVPDPLLVASSLDPDLRRRLAAAARGLDEDPAAREVLAGLKRAMGLERFE